MPRWLPADPPRLAATVALAGGMTLLLGLADDSLLLVDLVIAYIGLALVVGYLFGRRYAAVAVLLAPVAMAVLLLADTTATPGGADPWLRTAGVAILAIAAIYAIPRWLSGAQQARTESAQLKELTDTLRESELRLRSFVENTPLILYAIDTSERITLMEGKGLETIGRRPGEYVGDFMAERCKDDPAFIANVRLALAGESPAAIESIAGRWFDTHYTPVRVDEHVTGAIVVALDVTDREYAEHALQESEVRHRLVARATSDAIWDWDLIKDAIWWNDGIRTIFGHEDIATAASWWIDHIHPDDRQRVTEDIYTAIEGEGETWSAEYRFQRADGEYAQVQDRGYLLRDEQGKAWRMFGAMMDVTARRRLEEQYFQAQKMESIGRLAGGVAHDFSNLMTAIIVNAELDLISPPDDEQLRQDLEDIRQTAERAVNLAQQLLAFSRQQMIEPQFIDLNELIRSTERMLVRLIGADIEFDVRTDHQPAIVKIDAGQFEQVLVNLAVNARDAMPAGGRLTIETSRAQVDSAFVDGNRAMAQGKYVVLVITDTGAGMTDDVRQHIFEPFFTTKEVGKGTGLGLATCYGIVKQAGGDIWANSAPGAGTSFRIYLPLAAVPDMPSPREISEESMPRGDETILLVEDEPSVRRTASRVLRGLGYNVLEAEHGAHALELIESGNDGIDLLLTDVVMPQMGGKDLSDRFLELCPDSRLLFISGYTDNAIMRRGVSDRSIDFLQKPFSPGGLASKVRAVLDRGRV